MAIRALAFLLLVTMPTLAVAQSDSDEACRVYGEIAEKVMLVRQNGVALSSVLDRMAKGDDPDINASIRSMILSAYESPQFSTDEYRNAAAAEFRNNMELECYKAG